MSLDHHLPLRTESKAPAGSQEQRKEKRWQAIISSIEVVTRGVMGGGEKGRVSSVSRKENGNGWVP